MSTSAELWADERERLLGVAYRMLGRRSDAEDVLQDAYVRLQRAGLEEIEEPAGWLTMVVSRLCLDRLRSAPARRETYVGPWLPEPLVEVSAPDPADDVMLAESVSLAFLIVLESLSPAQRVAFLMHDVFGYTYRDLSRILDRSQDACRHLVSRARQHVDARRPRFETDRESRDRIVTAFLAACNSGELAPLLELLTADAVVVNDGGGRVPAARNPIVGADRVARFVLGLVSKGTRQGFVPRVAEVNATLGVIIESPNEGTYGIAAFDVAEGKVDQISLVTNPEKVQNALARTNSAIRGLDKAAGNKTPK